MDCCDLGSRWEDATSPATWGLRWFSDSAQTQLRNLIGHTFEVEFHKPKGSIVQTKTTGIVGGDGGLQGEDPNVVVTWDPDEFAGLSGTYWLRVVDLTDGRPIGFSTIRVLPTPVAV
jgi:hypothetical protein